jgi:hypothetical protein
MHGYDEADSLRTGAHTRRRLRRCGRLADDTTAVADPYHDCGLGWSHWPGDGSRGRRSSRAGRAAADSARLDTALGQRRAFLWRRMGALEEELDRVKALLLEYTPDDARDQQ